MTLPLNHSTERSRLAAQQLFADVVAKLQAASPGASPELVRCAAMADLQARHTEPERHG